MTAKAISNRYLDINPEGQLLQEAQDIAEELMIMMHIYNQQHTVVREFRRHLTGLKSGELSLVPGGLGDENIVLQKLDRILSTFLDGGTQALRDYSSKSNAEKASDSDELTRSTAEAIRKSDILIELIYNRRCEIQELEEAALRTCRQVSGLISL